VYHRAGSVYPASRAARTPLAVMSMAIVVPPEVRGFRSIQGR
jgi:hypothetical protein